MTATRIDEVCIPMTETMLGVRFESELPAARIVAACDGARRRFERDLTEVVVPLPRRPLPGHLHPVGSGAGAGAPGCRPGAGS